MENNKVNTLIRKMDSVLSNEITERHSVFQIKNFIIGKEPTIQAKLWRCIRELNSRKETLENLLLEMDEQKENIRLLELDIQEINKTKTENEIETERNKININKKTRRIHSINKKIHELEIKAINIAEECEVFVSSFEELSKIEKIKAFDDEKSQREYWNNKFALELNIREMFGLHPDIELLKSILSLEEGCQIKKVVEKIIEKRIKMMQDIKTNNGIALNPTHRQMLESYEKDQKLINKE